MKTTSAKGTHAAEPGLAPVEHQESERRAKIAEHIYNLAMARGFAPVCELDDWLGAERALQ